MIRLLAPNLYNNMKISYSDASGDERITTEIRLGTEEDDT